MSDQVTVTMHSKSGCPACERARAYMAEHSIPFNEVKLEEKAERAMLYDRLGLVGPARTVPQVEIEAEGCVWHVGNAEQLAMSGLHSLFYLKPSWTVLMMASADYTPAPEVF